jgi:Ca-activated chloride channel family protein
MTTHNFRNVLGGLGIPLKDRHLIIACFGVMLLLAPYTPVKALAAESPDNLYRQGKYQEAMRGYEQLDLDHPKEIRYRFNRGCAAYQFQDYQSARAAFTSVYSRSQDNTMQFKAAYNLGNTGYQTGDFQAAADYFKEAIRLNPKSAEARYNLELALKKIEQEKKQPEQNKQGKDSQQKQDQRDKQPGAQQEQKQDQQGNGDQDQNRTKAQTKEQPKDLSGDLNAKNPSQMQKSAGTQGEQQEVKSVERKKAEALLNNIQEDRTRHLRMQAPEGKNGDIKSGKYW